MEPGLSRSSSLHKTTPSLREVCKNASGSDIVFFGDSSTPSVISQVTVCSAEFMASVSEENPTKRQVFAYFNSYPWYAIIWGVKTKTLSFHTCELCGRTVNREISLLSFLYCLYRVDLDDARFVKITAGLFHRSFTLLCVVFFLLLQPGKLSDAVRAADCICASLPPAQPLIQQQMTSQQQGQKLVQPVVGGDIFV